MTLGIFLWGGFFEFRWWFFDVLSNGSSIFGSYTPQLNRFHVREPRKINIMEYRATLYSEQLCNTWVGDPCLLLNARRGYNLVGNLSHPWNRKTSGCTLHFLILPLESTCNLASVELLLVSVAGCAYRLQSPSGAAGVSLGLLTGRHQIAEGSHSWSRSW